MPLPLAIPIGAAVGGFLLSPTDSSSTDEVMKKVGFNHPEKYKQIKEGNGVPALEPAIRGWQDEVASDFERVASLLQEANTTAGVMWEGQAAEQHGTSLAPMTQFIHDAKDVSTAVGKIATDQADEFSRINHSMPEPVEVTATDSLLEKGGAWLTGTETDLQQQEREAQERAEEAKRYYENYDRAASATSASLPSFPVPPEMAYDQGSQESTERATVNTPTNPSSIGSRSLGGDNYGIGSVTPGGNPGGGSELPGGGYTGTPSGSTSQWTSPSPVGGGQGVPNLPGTTPGGPGPNGPGIGLGMMPPGGGSGTGLGAGGRGLGAGGAGGRGVGGLGSGSGSGNGLGAGGRAGAGGLGAGGAGGASGSGAAGAAGRGGAAAAGAGAAGRGRGQEGEDDLEHENKYMIDTDEAWEDLGLPRVAPPVFGE
ncbi:hypothetical protein [Saccharopolyspora hordei]|uniref:PPE domain-containing protein n=1 Tax=Saccharopolyspora hordei TaxID=1838 RepID=A0A853ABR2_9PSEU|nr:hypothetical protein [Saccharopolyspora hordei]NYI81555.1 hypothetical protein [Saccharopolyspora hordei]